MIDLAKRKLGKDVYEFPHYEEPVKQRWGLFLVPLEAEVKRGFLIVNP